MSEIIGVTFPVPKRSIDRFFKEDKTVFIKPATLFKDIKKGQKFIFYQSHEDTGYAGEATIKSIVIRENPLDFFGIYGDKIFLTKNEVEKYIDQNKKWRSLKNRSSERRKIRPWIAIELKDIRKYPEVKKINRFVPVSGMYIKE